MKTISWLVALMLVLTIAQPTKAQETNQRKKSTPAEARLADQKKKPAPAAAQHAAAPVKLIATAAPLKREESPKSPAAPAKPVAADKTPDAQVGIALLTEMQKQIQDLRDEIQRLAGALRQSDSARQQIEQTSKDAQTRAAAVETAYQQNNGVVAKLDKDVADMKLDLAKAGTASKDGVKRLESAESTLARFRFLGDVRLRYEDFLQSYEGCTACDSRNRPRLRFRFGVESKLNEDFTSGFLLASGSFTDPISTNETLGSLFGRKTIGIDRAWISYQPKSNKWLQLTGGKFANQWARTPLTIDNDLNAEGFSEKFSFDLKNASVKNVTFAATQFTFNEVASGKDSYALGGQLSTRLQLGKGLALAPSVSLLSWTRPDVIARSAAAKTLTGNIYTNATTPDGKAYLSGFLSADYILDASVRSPWERFPVRVVLDYVKNMRAASNRDTGYWGEFTIGQTKNRNDFQFLYNYAVIEQDAVLAAFTESDLRAGTNVRQNRFGFLWALQSNTTAGYTLWLGRTLNSSLQNSALTPGIKPGQQEPYLKRMQFDLTYKF